MRKPLLTILLLILIGSLPRAFAAQPPLRIAYVDWSSSVASANLICVLVQERLQQPCELREFSAEGMWRAVATGQADVLLSAWLPSTHAHFLERYGDRLMDLGPNLEGTRTGLVVPSVKVGRQTSSRGMRNPAYVAAESIGDLVGLGERFHYRIIGIDPEAGIMRTTRRAMQVYGLDNYRLVEGSERNMTKALSEAIGRQQPILLTGWVPHWMFDRWSLRFLDDPEGVYGGSGRIHTLVRPGLEAEMPKVYALLDRFHWDVAQMNRLLIWNQQDKGLDPYGTARRWIQTHPDQVSVWFDRETD
jgi:glycine betaine/proline transport system substrate-binding protein